MSVRCNVGKQLMIISFDLLYKFISLFKNFVHFHLNRACKCSSFIRKFGARLIFHVWFCLYLITNDVCSTNRWKYDITSWEKDTYPARYQTDLQHLLLHFFFILILIMTRYWFCFLYLFPVCNYLFLMKWWCEICGSTPYYKTLACIT